MQLNPELRLLGGFALAAAGPSQSPSLPRKAKALLAYLALHPDRAQSRDKLAALLWEESGETLARQSLRQSLSALRKALPREGLLEADSESVMLVGLDVDALAFERLAPSQVSTELELAVGLYGGELLEGFHARADAFDEWLIEQRSYYRELAIAAMARLLEQRLAEDPDEPTLRLAHRLVALDPLRESAHRALMTIYARLGRPNEAARRYRHLRRLLWVELDAEPEPETVQLHREIMETRGRHHAPISELDISPGASGLRIAADSQIPAALRAVDSAPQPEPDLEPQSEPECDPESTPQLRQVTLLGLSWIPPQALMEADAETLRDYALRFQCLVTETADRFKGQLLESGPSGCTLVFGLPKAGSDDPECALRVGLTLRDALHATANGSLRAALDCGQVLREVGEDRLALSGTVLHRCAELLRAAPSGDVLVTEAVFRRLRQLAEADCFSEAPMSAWRIRRLTSTPSISAAPMVGREAELSIIVAGLGACAEAGVGSTMLIRGEAGIGKTRLVDEVRGRAIGLGFDVVPTRVLDFGGTAEDPITRLVSHLLTDSPAPSTDALVNGSKNAWEGAPGDDGPAQLLRALELATTNRERARTLLELSRVQAVLDEPEPALQSLAEAQSAARAAGEASLEGDIRFQRGNVLFNLARLDDCLQSHRSLADDARRSGSVRHEALAEGGLGDAYYLRGRMITAHRHFARCVELARARGLAQLIPANLGMQAWTAFYCNRLPEAIPLAEEALGLARERFIRTAKASSTASSGPCC
jgi:DNA-binding SARP family transcriptional activator